MNTSKHSVILLFVGLLLPACNKSVQEFHQENSVQQEQLKLDSNQGNTKDSDQAVTPRQESLEQSDHQNTEDSSSPSEAVLADDKDNQPSEPNSAIDNNNIQDHSAEIATATQTIYDSLIALQSEFMNCYSKTLKEFDYEPKVNKTKWYIFPPSMHYDIEYDEYGTIYYKEGFASHDNNPSKLIQFLDSCIDSVIPKSIDNINLSHFVRSFPDGVQKFGRLELVFKIDPRPDVRSLSVYVEDQNSFPIGTKHPMANEVDKTKWIDVNKHYTQWLSHRNAQKSRE